MDLDHDNLSLIDPQDMSLLHMECIQSIRVWGVGRDNGRSVQERYICVSCGYGGVVWVLGWVGCVV